MSLLYLSLRVALSSDSWNLSVAVRTTCFLVLSRRAFLYQNCWSKMLSYGLNGSTYSLNVNKVTGECYVLIGLYPCSEPIIGRVWLTYSGLWIRPTLDLKWLPQRWQRGWMHVKQSITVSISKCNLVSTHCLQPRLPPACFVSANGSTINSTILTRYQSHSQLCVARLNGLLNHQHPGLLSLWPTSRLPL